MRPISTGLFFFSFVSGNAKVLTQRCGTTYNISNGCTTSCLRLLLQNTAALGSLPPTAVPSSVSESPALGLYHILCSLPPSCCGVFLWTLLSILGLALSSQKTGTLSLWFSNAQHSVRHTDCVTHDKCLLNEWVNIQSLVLQSQTEVWLGVASGRSMFILQKRHKNLLHTQFLIMPCVVACSVKFQDSQCSPSPRGPPRKDQCLV